MVSVGSHSTSGKDDEGRRKGTGGKKRKENKIKAARFYIDHDIVTVMREKS